MGDTCDPARDPSRRPIAVRYEPPDGLGPAEVGTLMDDSADHRDLTATLVDLAVRGWIRIEQRESSRLLGLVTRHEYRFALQKPRTAWGALKAHEQALLRGFFERGDEVVLGDLENRFYRHVPEVQAALFEELLARRCWARRPDRVRRFWTGAAVAVAVALLVAGNALSARGDVAPMAIVTAAVLTPLVVLLFRWLMPAKTAEGTRTLETVLGFQEFLGRVDGDRLARVVKTPELFERFLPFAMALGVARSWADAFAGVCTQPPSWYHGRAGAFEPRDFVGDIEHMAGRTAATLVSAPRSAGGASGFSTGGGFSGGGRGGGGGGGF